MSQGPTGSGFGSQATAETLEWGKDALSQGTGTLGVLMVGVQADSSALDCPQAVSGATTRYGLALALLQAAGVSSKDLSSAESVAALAVARGMFDSAGENSPSDLRFSDVVNRAEAAKRVFRLKCDRVVACLEEDLAGGVAVGVGGQRGASLGTLVEPRHLELVHGVVGVFDRAREDQIARVGLGSVRVAGDHRAGVRVVDRDDGLGAAHRGDESRCQNERPGASLHGSVLLKVWSTDHPA